MLFHHPGQDKLVGVEQPPAPGISPSPGTTVSLEVLGHRFRHAVGAVNDGAEEFDLVIGGSTQSRERRRCHIAAGDPVAQQLCPQARYGLGTKS